MTASSPSVGQHPPDDEVHNHPAHLAQKLRDAHHLIGRVCLLNNGVLAECLQCRAGCRPYEVWTTNAGVPEFPKLMSAMFSRISLRTVVSQPGRAGGRFWQTIQTDDERAADAKARVLRLLISVLNWPGTVDDESSAYQGAYQCFPSIRLLVGKNDHESPILSFRASWQSAKRAGHTVFISSSLRSIFVAAESTRSHL